MSSIKQFDFCNFTSPTPTANYLRNDVHGHHQSMFMPQLETPSPSDCTTSTTSSPDNDRSATVLNIDKKLDISWSDMTPPESMPNLSLSWLMSELPDNTEIPSPGSSIDGTPAFYNGVETHHTTPVDLSATSQIMQHNARKSSEFKPYTMCLSEQNASQIRTEPLGRHSPIYRQRKKSKEKIPVLNEYGMEYCKPKYSYTCLIILALKNSRENRMSVNEIYSFIMTHFPYFQSAPDGWKNSIRHNLSLNKCFRKFENPDADLTRKRKICLWGLNPFKAKKIDDELVKWRQKDPDCIRLSMKYPNQLENLEQGLYGESGAPTQIFQAANSPGFYNGSPNVYQHNGSPGFDAPSPVYHSSSPGYHPLSLLYTGNQSGSTGQTGSSNQQLLSPISPGMMPMSPLTFNPILSPLFRDHVISPIHFQCDPVGLSPYPRWSPAGSCEAPPVVQRSERMCAQRAQETSTFDPSRYLDSLLL